MPQVSEGNTIVRPTLHHVNLKTTRLQEMIDWYATVVGEQARRAAAEAIRAAKDSEFHSLGLVLGYQYDASPVIVDDGTPAGPERLAYEPSARPGARLPHA